MRFDEHFLRGALPDVSILYDTYPHNVNICVNTKVLESGQIFVALPGSHCDGHDFLQQALQKNAAGLIINASKKNLLKKIDSSLLKKTLIIAVKDTQQALFKLASAWRLQFEYPVVGITGSVGKTTTKEFVAQILKCNGSNFFVSRANQNTQIGVAINMLQMRKEHQAAIFEVGISKRGEMRKIANMLRPTTGVITNIGHAHMEGLGSLADIALEKRDIFHYFTEESIGIINGDQSILSKVGYVHPMIKFGSKTTNQVQARKIHVTGDKTLFVLKIYNKKYPVVCEQGHEGIVFNSLAAAAVTHLLGVPDATIVEGIQHPPVIEGRYERKNLKTEKGFIINDCYNANPESMKASLLAFQHIDTPAQKVAVLGDMLELGVNSPFWHRQLGRFLRKVPSLKHLILVGSMVKWTKKTVPVGLKVDLVPDWQGAVKKLQETLSDESMILVKGSRATGLDNLVKEVT